MPDILISSKNNEYIMGENGRDLFLNKTCLVGYVGIYPLVIKHGHRKSPIATVKKNGFSVTAGGIHISSPSMPQCHVTVLVMAHES
jgi:hypothetical protein